MDCCVPLALCTGKLCVCECVSVCVLWHVDTVILWWNAFYHAQDAGLNNCVLASFTFNNLELNQAYCALGLDRPYCIYSFTSHFSFPILSFLCFTQYCPIISSCIPSSCIPSLLKLPPNLILNFYGFAQCLCCSDNHSNCRNTYLVTNIPTWPSFS